VYIKIAKKTETGEEVFESKRVSELSAGKSFGELAIMDEVLKPRKATIITKEDCHFATLSRQAFQSTLGHIKKELQNQIETFTANPIFSKTRWSNRAIEQWLKSFEVMGQLNRNNVLYKEGDYAEDIYFIKSGELTCVKRVEIVQPFDFKKDIILDEKNQIYHLEKDPLYKDVEICKWGEGVIFGEEEAAQVYKHEKQMEKDREKIKREFQEKILYERRKAEQEGYLYRPPKDFYLPDDPNEDEDLIEQLAQKKIEQVSKDTYKRETTVFVSSQKAEVWKISKKLFFAHLEVNSSAWKQMEILIEGKKRRRQERIEEFQRCASSNLEFIAKQSPSFVKKDLLSLIKKKKQMKHEKQNKIVCKDDPVFPVVVKSLKAIKEAKQKQAERMMNHTSGTMNTIYTEGEENYATEFEIPQLEMRHRSIITIRPDPVSEQDVMQELRLMTTEADGSPPQKTIVNRTSMELEHFHLKSFKAAKSGPTFDVFQPLYGSFLAQLDNSNFNRYLKKRSKIYTQEERKLKESSLDIKRPNENIFSATADVFENKSMIIYENPLRGLNYTSNIVYQVGKKSKEESDRVTSHEKFYSTFDPERTIKDRLSMKSRLMKKMGESSPKKGSNQDAFFSINDLLESEENFIHDFRQLSRLDKLYDIRMEAKYGPNNPARKENRSKRSSIDMRRPSTSVLKHTKTEDSRINTEEDSLHIIHEFHKRESPKAKKSSAASRDVTPPRDITPPRDVTPPPEVRDSFKITSQLSAQMMQTQSQLNKDIATTTTTDLDSSLVLLRSHTPCPVINRKTLSSFLHNPEKVKESLSVLRDTTKQTSNLLTDPSYVNLASANFSSFPKKPPPTTAKLPNQRYLNRYQSGIGIDPSNHVSRVIAREKKEHQRVLYEAPKFTPHHRVLSAHESNVLNRKPILDKAKVILDRMGRSPNLPPSIKKKIRRAKLIVDGKKEALVELPQKTKQNKSFA